MPRAIARALSLTALAAAFCGSAFAQDQLPEYGSGHALRLAPWFASPAQLYRLEGRSLEVGVVGGQAETSTKADAGSIALETRVLATSLSFASKATASVYYHLSMRAAQQEHVLDAKLASLAPLRVETDLTWQEAGVDVAFKIMDRLVLATGLRLESEDGEDYQRLSVKLTPALLLKSEWYELGLTSDTAVSRTTSGDAPAAPPQEAKSLHAAYFTKERTTFGMRVAESAISVCCSTPVEPSLASSSASGDLSYHVYAQTWLDALGFTAALAYAPMTREPDAAANARDFARLVERWHALARIDWRTTLSGKTLVASLSAATTAGEGSTRRMAGAGRPAEIESAAHEITSGVSLAF